MNKVETLEDNSEERVKPLKSFLSRRSFLGKSLAVGAGTIGAGLLANAPTARAQQDAPTQGDFDILRFLAAAELIEADLWLQYNELAGIQDGEVQGGTGNPAYTNAIKVLDEDMDQYIHDNTDDEITHAAFLNAYLTSKGAEPVNLDQFRTLPSSQATGARQIGRLTNLMQLTVDTSWWVRYRVSTKNPDFGDTFAQAIPDLFHGQFPAIPRNNADLSPPRHLQAIANTAGFHFGFIEQGGTSLYPSLAQRVTDPQVLRILLSIGPTEAMHFQTWHDKAGNAPALTDPTNGLTFPDLNAPPFGGAVPDQPDHARTRHIPQAHVPDRLDHSSDQYSRSCNGRAQCLDRGRPVHRSNAGLFCFPTPAGARSGSSQTRGGEK